RPRAGRHPHVRLRSQVLPRIAPGAPRAADRAHCRARAAPGPPSLRPRGRRAPRRRPSASRRPARRVGSGVSLSVPPKTSDELGAEEGPHDLGSVMEDGEFRGTIGKDWRESEPWWPDPVRPPAGAPNVVLVVLDDVGFAQLGCYGSDLRTPTFDRLAASGLRYTNFHTTALCSPTRACLMTGRNHHSVGMGRITDLARGFPGYSG